MGYGMDIEDWFDPNEAGIEKHEGCESCNNRYAGNCFKCGGIVNVGEGHLEYKSQRRWKKLGIPSNVKTIVQHCKCRGKT